MDKKAVYEVIDSKASEFAALSDAIWDYAELAFTEHQSAEALCRQLEKEGFAVTRGVAGIETAFTARYGSGKPVIGILGEFDALSGLSQKAAVQSGSRSVPAPPVTAADTICSVWVPLPLP